MFFFMYFDPVVNIPKMLDIMLEMSLGGPEIYRGNLFPDTFHVYHTIRDMTLDEMLYYKIKLKEN